MNIKLKKPSSPGTQPPVDCKYALLMHDCSTIVFLEKIIRAIYIQTTHKKKI